MKPMLTAHDVAERLRVSDAWVFDHASGRRRPVIPCVRIGKTVRFREDELEEWLSSLRGNKAA